MQIFIQEIKFNLKSFCIWSLSIILLIITGMAKYGTTVDSNNSLNQLASKMPEPIKAIMGFGSFDLSTALGYYGIVYFYVLLMLCAHSSTMGSDILSKEERDNTSEYIYTKPISRNRLLLNKLLAIMLLTIALNVVSTIASIITVNQYSQIQNTKQILNLMPASILVQCIFLSISLAISSISQKPKLSASISTGILLGTFLLSIVIDLNDKLNNLKYLSPFKYFSINDLLNLERIAIPPTLLSISIITISIFLCFWALNKRDLSV